MGDIPETRYAKTGDGFHVAFQVLGDGPPDLVFIPGFGGNVELGWEEPTLSRLYRRLGRYHQALTCSQEGVAIFRELGDRDSQAARHRTPLPEISDGLPSALRSRIDAPPAVGSKIIRPSAPRPRWRSQTARANEALSAVAGA